MGAITGSEYIRVCKAAQIGADIDEAAGVGKSCVCKPGIGPRACRADDKVGCQSPSIRQFDRSRGNA